MRRNPSFSVWCQSYYHNISTYFYWLWVFQDFPPWIRKGFWDSGHFFQFEFKLRHNLMTTINNSHGQTLAIFWHSYVIEIWKVFAQNIHYIIALELDCKHLCCFQSLQNLFVLKINKFNQRMIANKQQICIVFPFIRSAGIILHSL